MFLPTYLLKISCWKNWDTIKDANSRIVVIAATTARWSVPQTDLNTASEGPLG